MSLPPRGRREFFADAGGVLLCTLAGQQILTYEKADVETLAGGLEVPPKVAEARARREPSSATVLAQSTGPRKEYWIQAEQVRWNVVPTKRDEMMGKKVKGPTRFNAMAYRAYSPNFAAPLGPATIPGPTIDCQIGDTVVVHFRNKLKSPVTIHPHGVLYSVDMDGAYKGKHTDPGGFVQRNETFTYVWEAVEGTQGFWFYHDHGPMDPLPIYAGLFGPIIVRDPAEPQPTKQFITAFHSFQPVTTGFDKVFWCVNGRSFPGNTPTFRASVGDDVAFHIFALDDHFHTFHIHGHRWENAAGEVIDNVTLGPGDGVTARFVEDNPGRWLYHCHVFSHLHGGMNGWYIVE